MNNSNCSWATTWATNSTIISVAYNHQIQTPLGPKSGLNTNLLGLIGLLRR